MTGARSPVPALLNVIPDVWQQEQRGLNQNTLDLPPKSGV